jgi:hypothetical protein
MDTKKQVAAFLQQLGSSADEVAATLRAARIQGVRHAVRFLNPIVRYLQAALRLDNLDANMTTGVTVRFRLRDGEQEVLCPDAVHQFLQAFNRGAYPDLELPADNS